MKTRKINFDYLNLYKEVPLFVVLHIRTFFKKRSLHTSPAILIVNTSLIGEFMVTIPAMVDFIQRNSDKSIDIIVSPPLVPLAQKIVGIRTVFVATSIYERDNERHATLHQTFDTYENVVVLRMSFENYSIIKNISTRSVETALRVLLKYFFHLCRCVMLRKTPEKWGNLNFEMLHGTARKIAFNDMFHEEKADTVMIKNHPAFRTRGLKKNMIIHTGASWIMNRWSNDKWVELLRKLHQLDDFHYIFVGSKNEKDDYAYISSQLNFTTASVIADINLWQLVVAMKECQYFIGVDSGPRNIADLVNIPSITILGPGPHMFTPMNDKGVVIDKSDGKGLYQRFFYKKTNRFIDRIAADDVYEVFKNKLYHK